MKGRTVKNRDGHRKEEREEEEEGRKYKENEDKE